jgi:tetratricopeptide (TPR) repeat protein
MPRFAMAQEAPSPNADAPSVGWATARAAELVERGKGLAAHGDVTSATQCYLDAIRFDATSPAAYLALAGVYESTGDVREAERIYALGLDHVTSFADGFVARGHLRARLGLMREALADHEAAAALAPDSIGVLRELAAAYVAVTAWPAALAVTRRIVVLAELAHDERSFQSARAQARALARLLADADPVTAGRRQRGAVRRALSALASR